jgi:hypothetical protein
MAKKAPTAAVRAYKSKYGSGGPATSAAMQQVLGRGIRRSRLSQGLNPNTGGRITMGTINVKGLGKYEPATRQAIIKAAATKSTGLKGVKRNVKAILRAHK